MRVVVDTNVFVSSFLSPEGTPRKIIDLWKTGEVILCLSPGIIEEYVLVLGRLGLEGEPDMDELLELFKKKANILFTAPARPSFLSSRVSMGSLTLAGVTGRCRPGAAAAWG